MSRRGTYPINVKHSHFIRGPIGAKCTHTNLLNKKCHHDIFAILLIIDVSLLGAFKTWLFLDLKRVVKMYTFANPDMKALDLLKWRTRVKVNTFISRNEMRECVIYAKCREGTIYIPNEKHCRLEFTESVHKEHLIK